ncbi:hypothetical protein DESPIG_01774 [Desulfovibrio piger ATCC 29098]|uniref:Uncharacterized protein n=1 Tax=Desulfovibrio piger ATCC 29098 TaxID=411464 RepID=B6WUI6_9BACT|nr:hypothetical protein DESPIG_01774 [Desulfovibrio piger ATCC 29098]
MPAGCKAFAARGTEERGRQQDVRPLPPGKTARCGDAVTEGREREAAGRAGPCAGDAAGRWTKGTPGP